MLNYIYQTSISKDLISLKICLSVKWFPSIAPEGHVDTHVPHPRQSVSSTTGVILPGSNFIALYEKYALSFDETYYDLCKAIENPLLKQPNHSLISAIEAILAGKIILKGSHFYLQTERGEISIFMVSEGWRKLGMLAYLIANDSLKQGTTLFWDEPETNLNPRLMKQLAEVLIELTRHNVQIIIASHHLFLMKYFDYLLGNTKIPAAFFSLTKAENGVVVEQGTRLKHLNTIIALEEELELYDKEQQALYANL